MRPLFIFATELEASAFLEESSCRAISPHLWDCKLGYLLITGMGSLAGATRLAHALYEIPKSSSLINMGCVASLRNHNAFDCLQIQEVSKYLERGAVDAHSRQLFDKVFPSLKLAPLTNLKLPQATLLSVDCPLHHTEKRDQLSAIADVLDMEGYGLSFAAQECLRPLSMIKCISDFGKEGGFKELQKNIHHCSQKLLQIAKELVSS